MFKGQRRLLAPLRQHGRQLQVSLPRGLQTQDGRSHLQARAAEQALQIRAQTQVWIHALQQEADPGILSGRNQVQAAVQARLPPLRAHAKKVSGGRPLVRPGLYL